MSDKTRTEKKEEIRQSHWKKQLGLCHWCGMFMEWPIAGKDWDWMATIDHLHTKGFIGRGKDWDSVLAHKICNNWRHNKARLTKKQVDQIRILHDKYTHGMI